MNEPITDQQLDDYLAMLDEQELTMLRQKYADLIKRAMDEPDGDRLIREYGGLYGRK